MTKPGVLLIHGFTSHRSSLEAVLPLLDKRQLDWNYPTLAGHGTHPRDLTSVRWADWEEDIEAAYTALREHHETVVVIALSMGTLLAIDLAIKHPQHIAGLILLSPCVVFKSRLAPLTPILTPLLPRMAFPATDRYSSKKYAQHDRGYPWFPTAPFRSYWNRARTILHDAKRVRCPVRIIQSRLDKVADPIGAKRLYDTLSVPKELFWHDISGHEMLLDVEVKQVVGEITSFPPLSRD